MVSPTRSDGGQRLYSDLDMERLLRLRRLTERGHAIGRIASLPLAELTRLDEEIAEDEESSAAGGQLERTGGALARGDVREFTCGAAGDPASRCPELQAVLERAAVTLGVPASSTRWWPHAEADRPGLGRGVGLRRPGAHGHRGLTTGAGLAAAGVRGHGTAHPARGRARRPARCTSSAPSWRRPAPRPKGGA